MLFVQNSRGHKKTSDAGLRRAHCDKKLALYRTQQRALHILVLRICRKTGTARALFRIPTSFTRQPPAGGTVRRLYFEEKQVFTSILKETNLKTEQSDTYISKKRRASLEVIKKNKSPV
jgi:hypothetical protein